jgi:hypothetical protein
MAFKKINPKEKVFYIIELSSIEFSVFDSEFDQPIYNGNWNLTASIIKSIKQNMPKATINYYIKEKSGLLKYNPQWSYVP